MTPLALNCGTTNPVVYTSDGSNPQTLDINFGVAPGTFYTIFDPLANANQVDIYDLTNSELLTSISMRADGWTIGEYTNNVGIPLKLRFVISGDITNDWSLSASCLNDNIVLYDGNEILYRFANLGYTH